VTPRTASVLQEIGWPGTIFVLSGTEVCVFTSLQINFYKKNRDLQGNAVVDRKTEFLCGIFLIPYGTHPVTLVQQGQ
jgi:hypothetical protein